MCDNRCKPAMIHGPQYHRVTIWWSHQKRFYVFQLHILWDCCCYCSGYVNVKLPEKVFHHAICEKPQHFSSSAIIICHNHCYATVVIVAFSHIHENILFANFSPTKFICNELHAFWFSPPYSRMLFHIQTLSALLQLNYIWKGANKHDTKKK